MDIANLITNLARPYPSDWGGVQFFVVNDANCSKILLFLPYSPYLPNPDGYANIDAYYIASNKLYHTQQSIIATLAQYDARCEYNDIKTQFQNAGCGIRLYNSLIAIPPYGTKVALAIVTLNGNFKEYRQQLVGSCDNCGRCIKACPSGGLTATGFVRQNCLRDAMDNYTTTRLDISYLGRSMLGCDICQSVCPHNNAMPRINAPVEFMELLSFRNLSIMFKVGKKGLMALAPFIGTNYIRVSRLAYFAINAVKCPSDSYFLTQFFDYQDKFVANFAKEKYNQLIKSL